MADEARRELLEGETLIWQGQPGWRAWAGWTILGWITFPIFVGMIILAVLAIRRRSIAWLVTTRRIETEIGWLSRRVDTLELWRVKDLEYRQGLWDRMFGVSSILLTAHDESAPQLPLRGLPPGRNQPAGDRVAVNGLEGRHATDSTPALGGPTSARAKRSFAGAGPRALPGRGAEPRLVAATGRATSTDGSWLALRPTVSY